MKGSSESVEKFLRALFSRKIVVFCGAVVILFIITAFFAPYIAPYDPDYADFAAFLEGPSKTHLLGTDSYGRDVLSRIVYGTRVSLIIGVLAVIIACVIGTFFGMVAGYFGGIVDDIITRLTEAVRAIPQVVLAMALTAVLSIKESDYVMAAKLQGNSNFQIMFRHILPNSISPIIVMMTQQVGSTILSEAGLSFLGLGISAPTASWGSMVSEGRVFLLQNPVFALTPGICVAVLVICLNMFGDGIRDALDPRLRGEL